MAKKSKACEKFLSPAKIGKLELKNRSVLPPMGTAYAVDHHVVDRAVDYHVRIAQGGCAMNIVEIAAVHETSRMAGIPGIWDDKFIPGLTKLAKGIKDAGSRACIQLWHGGRQVSGAAFGGQSWAPSAIPCPMMQEVPHEMTNAEVKEVIESYGDAAIRAKKAGFDAVELHGAHGYLINCFLNPYSNTRTDEYGGSFENRLRFGLEVIENVRSKVGPDFPVIMRLSMIQHVENGIELEDGIKAALAYEKAGVDAIDVSQGCYGAIAYCVPPYYLPIGVNVNNAEAVKKLLKIPVIVAGRITSPEFAEEILQAGKADFIALGRVQIADPDFVLKAAEGRSDEIMRCIACNQGCVAAAFTGGGVSCMVNPAVGKEKEVVIAPAKVKKNILVIGGGPAGLEAARVAAMRGHSVTLFEKSTQLGGQLINAGFTPNKVSFKEGAQQLAYRAMKAGVDIHILTKASADNISNINPDEIIIATGSKPSIPAIPGVDGKNVYEARSIMGTNRYVPEDNIVVVGGGLVGLEAMEILTCQGKKVTVVEMTDAVGKEMNMFVIPYFMGFVQQHQIDVRTSTKCVEIGADHVVVENSGKTEKLPCNAVVIATGAEVDQGVFDIVKETGIPYKVIGDAEEPADALKAIHAGNAVARAI